MSILRTLDRLIEDSPADVRLLSVVALVAGLAGLLLAFRWAVSLLALGQDARRRAKQSPVPAVTRVPNPLDALLGPLGQPLVIAVTPDAVWAAISSRLGNRIDEMRLAVRFCAYLPLLVGLAATMLGLSQVAGQLGPSMSDTARAGLSGVFLGTLSGIVGSVLASVGSLGLGRAGSMAAIAVEDYVHTCILPAIPERRIGLKVEDTVLQVIAERTRAVVDHFRESLFPIANELKGAAEKSASAASSAAKALDHAAGVVQRSGSLSDAANIIAANLKRIEEAAVAVERAAMSAREAAAVEERLRSQLVAAAEQSQRQAAGVVESGAVIGKRIDELMIPMQTFASTATNFMASTKVLGQEVHAVSGSFLLLATEVKARNELERSHIEGVEKQLAALGSPMEQLKATLKGIGDELSKLAEEGRAIRGMAESFSRHASTDIAAEIGRQFTTLSERLRAVLAEISSIIPQSKGQLEDAGRGLRDLVGEVRGQVPDMQRTTEEVARYRDELHAVSESLAAINVTLKYATETVGATAKTVSPAPPEIPHLEAAIKELSSSSSALRQAMQELARSLNAVREADRASGGRRWWWSR